MRHPDFDLIMEYLRVGNFTIQVSFKGGEWKSLNGSVTPTMEFRYRRKPIQEHVESSEVRALYLRALSDTTIEWLARYTPNGHWQRHDHGFLPGVEYREVEKFAIGDHVAHYLTDAGAVPFIVQVIGDDKPYSRDGQFTGLVVQSNPGQWPEGYMGSFYYHQFSKEQ